MYTASYYKTPQLRLGPAYNGVRGEGLFRWFLHRWFDLRRSYNGRSPVTTMLGLTYVPCQHYHFIVDVRREFQRINRRGIFVQKLEIVH